ncbi:hypothetical protein Cni_G06086 [Canna indica]|uniref:Uncharacterized protein n=1 Tax=Canna indica TaxID=4628 RepID=A0AAQ3JXW0_9LILI|nr:hypothetical protein Cni_G06086 [Canna indica]
MANAKAASTLRSSTPAGKQSLLPPRCPYPTLLSQYGDHGPTASRDVLDSGNVQNHHRHTSSESFLFEEQPPWLDDLLNEPETPVKGGAHRRSSSDSFAYLNGVNISSSITNLHLDDCNQRTVTAPSPWRLNELDSLRSINHGSYNVQNNSFERSPLGKDKMVDTRTVLEENNVVLSDTTEKKVQQEEAHDPKGSSGSLLKQSEVDPRSAKQQFARRSRVWKLEYIAELERNVQTLQAEGSEISAELEFLDRQNLILSLENRSLKQRLDNLSQEQLIKHLQQEMLEREIARLRGLYQQQQQQQQKQSRRQSVPIHTRNRSRDLDSEFASLSLNHKDMNTDPATNPLRI